LLAVAMLFIFSTNAFAQSMDTAYVPFSVNVNATATAQLAGGGKFEQLVRSGYTDTLLIVTEGSTPLSRQGKTPSSVTMYSSRGRISLELSRQLYRNTDITLYSLNGKRILHGKAVASEAVKSISHPNVAMGVYLLSVKGVNGGTFTTRLAHTGGGLNIDVAFANGNSGLLLEKAISGNWTITVSAEGYLDTSYAFVPETGRGNTRVQEITLWQMLLSSSSEVIPPSSSGAESSSSSSSYSINNSSSSSTYLPPPSPPTNITATANSVNSITVSWNSVTGATGYFIYRSTTADGTYSQVGGTSTTTSYTNTSLSAGITYYYKVAAYYGGASAITGTQSGYTSATTPPDAPTNVTAKVNSESSITVSWGAVTGGTEYYIYRSTTADGTYDSVGTSATNSYKDSSLPSSTTYYYKVAAYNSGGIGNQSSYASTTTLPDVPTNVTATANSVNSITISWESVTGTTGYYIYRSTTANGTYSQVATSATTSYTNTGLSSGTAYYYKVAAYNNGGTGTQSSYASAITLLDVPTNVKATASSVSSITVSWGSVTGATGYYIYRSTTADGTYDSVGTSKTTSYANIDLSSVTTYYYKVAAYNNVGTGNQSYYASTTTLPDVPTNVTAIANSVSSITVSWESVTGATRYYIYRSTTADGTYSEVGNSTTTSYTNTYLLSSGTAYYYKVAAYNSGGTGTRSGYVSVITPPSVPTGVTATANSESNITVSWGSVTGAAGYYIYRSTTAGGTYDSVGTSATTSYTNTSLSSGTRYYYKVAAYNSGGIGNQSGNAYATTLPDVPTNVTATTNSVSSITVSWESVTGATGYYIYRSTTANGTYDSVGTSATNSYTNTGLSSGTAYYYKVTAYNSGGTGTQSSYTSVTTLPGMPTGVTAIANSVNSITISWEFVSGATGYYIYRNTTAGGTYDSVGISATTSYTNIDLSSGTAYYYRVAAYNSGGIGNQSNYASAALLDAPAGVTATANSESNITVSWEFVNGATGYRIYRSTTADGTYTQIGTSYTTSYTEAGSANTTYYYKVASYNNGGVGNQSSYASVITPPSAPTNVRATTNSESSITVSWESVTGATGYYIYHSENYDGTYSEVGTSATNSYTNTGLLSDIRYYYKVTAYNNGGMSNQSGYTYATTLLSAPTNVTATATSESRITISWESVTGATLYSIYRSTTADGTYDFVDYSTKTSYTNAGLSSGTMYYYKVATHNSGGTNQSSYAYATTQPDMPIGVTAVTNSVKSITVNWESVTSATGYYIYRNTTEYGTYFQVGTSTTTSYTDNSLSPSTTYYYKVAAYNSGGTGNQSSYAYATTWIDVPTGVTATANSVSSITVNWNYVTVTTGYRIYRSTTADGTYTLVGTSATNSYTDDYLSSGTTYYYKVAAYNSGGTGNLSSYAYATTLLDVPTSVTATATSESSITVNWKLVTGAIGYYIYRSTTAGDIYTWVGTSETTSYIDNSLSVNTRYYYKVAAYNNVGTGNQSNYASATLLNAPTGITATAASESSITVSWESVTGATGYYIYRSTTTDGTYDSVGTSATTSYTNINLSLGTTYYYKVAAYNGGGTGNKSGYTYATPLLDAPTSVTATATSESSIIVSWESVPGSATEYRIYRSTTADGTYDSVGTSATTSYTNTGLSSGTAYYYKVAAYNVGGIGNLSSYAYVTTLPDVPTGVTTTANSESSITVSWSSVTGATRYYIYRSSTADGTYGQIVYVSSSTTSYTDNSLSSGTTYYYKVAAYNSGGTSNQSSYAYATTLPDAPTNIRATVNSESSITVSWGSVTGATGYYIYRSTTTDGTYDSVGTSATTSYTDNSLSAYTSYYYKVAAYNSGGTGNMSNYVYTTTLPDVPTGVIATAKSTSSITVSWESVTGANESTEYYIYRSSTADGTYGQIVHVSSSTTSYTDTGLLSGTTYYYRVAAYNSGRTGNLSSYAYATTQPSAPTGVTATANSLSSIIVSWQSVTGATGYYIYRSESYNGTYSEVGTSATTSYADNSLSAYTAYYYKVAAYNSGGTSNRSNYIASAATLPALSGVTATANSESSITVSWLSIIDATDYCIYRSTTADANFGIDFGTFGPYISATTSYTNTGLSSGTTYYYKVAACYSNSNGTVMASGIQSSYAYATTLPSAPTYIRATANSVSNITVSWPYDVPGATGYYIYRSTTADGTYNYVGTSTTTSYADNSLTSGTTYYYKVASYNSGGIGNQSSYASAATFLPTVSTCDGMAGTPVKIGSQTWMKRNLNCDVSGSKCYNNNSTNCNTYGRLYDWATTMNLPSSCNSTSCPVQLPHKGICPSGWHLPSDAEWQTLIDFAGGSSTAGRKLKATSGWNYDGVSGNGTDEHGFSALPGGSGLSDGSFGGVGGNSHWWSSTGDSNVAYHRVMSYSLEDVYRNGSYKSNLYYVRCLQD